MMVPVTRIAAAVILVLGICVPSALAMPVGSSHGVAIEKPCYKKVKKKGKLVRVKVGCPKPKLPPVPAPAPAPPPPPPGSTRSNPFPLGTAASVTGWTIKVNSVQFDAWPVVQAANLFNDPPASGWADVVVSLTMTYTGTSTGTPWLDNDLHYVGASNVSYPLSGFDHYCGVPPSPDLLDFDTVLPGGAVTGNVCFQVQTSDEPTLIGFWNGLFSSSIGPWFALR